MGLLVSKEKSNLKSVQDEENITMNQDPVSHQKEYTSNANLSGSPKIDGEPKPERKKSKVHFQFSEFTFERETTPTNVNEACMENETSVYRRTVSEVSVESDGTNNADYVNAETRSRPGSTATCSFYRSTSQLPGKKSEDGESEDGVFCEFSSLSINSSEYEQDDNGDGREILRRTTVSHLSLTCYNDTDDDNVADGHSAAHCKCGEHSRIKSQMSVTRVEHYDSEIRTPAASESGDSTPKERRKTTRKISQVTVTYYDVKLADENVEDDGKKRKKKESKGKGKSKKRRKKTIVHLADAAIEVCRSQKEIANYCLPLPSSQFIGQTTMSLHPDEVDKESRETLHLGVYLQHMDRYLRHFDTPDQFKGTEAYYLKLLRYIASKRRMPNETEDLCYARLLCDSKRFVVVYHQRGGFSQQIKEHNDYWGTRQQLLSAKVIADWVDKDNGPLDPIFGALLQPTTGRAGPGDACLFHHFVFDGHGHFAYHSAVHDAFGYLKVYHNVGPGYDYMYHSRFSTSSPLAGQIDGVNFWKKALKSLKMKPNVSELAAGALSLVPCTSESALLF